MGEIPEKTHTSRLQIAAASARSAFLPEVFGVYTDTGIAVRRDTTGGGSSPAGSAVGMFAAVSIAAAGILAVLVSLWPIR